ncbi:MAG: alpha/beta hydrolase [Ktedonobacteraceae bacterium]|nr:alpha/beta hydrolase [Ktedonobacteraceae bacterium]
MHYQSDAAGDWGREQASETVNVSTEMFTMADFSKIFLRSWQTDSNDILLILHGLGAHSGWFIDMGNELAQRGLTVYTMDHRGFGRSEGLAGHIDSYHLFVEDTSAIINELRKRHPLGRIYLLGHSMGGIFTAHVAARHSDLLAGIIFLNPWIEDSSRLSPITTLRILVGGLRNSRRAWQVAGGHEAMTTNPEAIQMLQADTFWRRTQTSSFLVQILQMRLAVMKLAKSITLPALVLQAEEDKSVLITGTRKFYDALASSDKTWKGYPGYAHDSELEADRSLMDNDIVDWIRAHV